MKKGPNGIDYEYEYVYYYYDDDEKDGKKTTVPTTEKAAEKDAARPTGGKNRYTSVDRSSSTVKSIPESNEIPVISSRGKGRQVIPVVEEVVEERLPANTRFPPRTSSVSHTPSVSVVSTVDETTKKISVKRPSLELVDSHSFSRGDKTKGSRVVESEFSKSSTESKDKSVIPLSSSSTTTLSDVNEASVASSTTTTASTPTASNDASTTVADEWAELTTQIMDRVALDLYAHLVNENSLADATTTPPDDNETAGITTDSTGSTETADEHTTYISPVSSTTTTTTEASTTTTTTTTETALLHGRKSPFGGRNRFRLRSSSTPASESVEQKEAATEATALKPKSTCHFDKH